MRPVRVIVFNMDESFGPTLRRTLQGFDRVRIVAEVDEPAMLPTVAQQFPAELLVLHLDPTPDAILPIAGDLVPGHPSLDIFAISESTDGQLILSAMRRGFREFITKPIDIVMLGEAIDKIAQRVEDGPPDGKLISVLGTAGGVGATALSTNLAVELKSMCPGNVTVVDLDYRFGQVATFLDVFPTYTIADLAQSTEELEQQVIDRTLVDHSSGVRVLSRPAHFVQSDNITAANCVNVLTNLLGMNEYVVVDGPNRYDPGASAILGLADVTLMVLQLLVPSVRNAQRILQGMEEAGFNLERAQLVVNRVGRESGPLGLSDIEGILNKKVFTTIPDDWQTMSTAINLGETVIQRGPKTKLRASIRALAQRIHDPDAVETQESEKKSNLLAKIFSEA
ncbi:MAG: hypothetical protein V3W34_01565 [Phycisphaerae bacterium]